MATKKNTFDAKAIAAELFACIGPMKDKLAIIAKGIRTQEQLDAVWAEFAKLAKGYSKGTLKVYKAMVKAHTSIPKANKGNRTAGAGRRGGRAEEEGEEETESPDESTPRSTLRAWLAIVPALKAHKLPLAQLVADLEAAYAKA